ncbi:MAG: YraN family protein [Candidatus Latescibacterota bacterium]
MNTKTLGELGERIAGTFLQIKGYRVVERNYRYAGREIDLLVTKGALLAAVEVKLRRGGRFGSASQAVDAKKLGRVRVAMEGFLSAAPAIYTPRIDLVVIDYSDDLGDMLITHLEGVY